MEWKNEFAKILFAQINVQNQFKIENKCYYFIFQFFARHNFFCDYIILWCSWLIAIFVRLLIRILLLSRILSIPIIKIICSFNDNYVFFYFNTKRRWTRPMEKLQGIQWRSTIEKEASWYLYGSTPTRFPLCHMFIEWNIG